MFEELSTEESEIQVLIAGVAIMKSLWGFREMALLFYTFVWNFMKCCVLAEPKC